MARFHAFALLLLGIAFQSASAADPTFKPLILPDSIRFVQLFSEDKRVGTMLFDNFVIATEIGRGSLPSVATKKFTYVLHPESTAEVVVRQLIRGFVSHQGSGSATVVIHSGGKSTLVDLDKAIQEAKGGSREKNQDLAKKARAAAKQQGLVECKKPDRSDDYLVLLETRVPAGKPLQVTIGLLVDRLPGDDSGAMLTVDSIDFEVSAAPPAKR